MQKLRSHIAKLCIISLICAGFGMYMVRPANAQQSTKAFSSWISIVVDGTHSSNLKQELDRMSNSGANVYKLMEHASKVMSKTDRESDLPLEADDASNHIFQVLLQQWNHFQTGNGMANIPPPEIVKTLVHTTVDKYGTTVFARLSDTRSSDIVSFHTGIQARALFFDVGMEPMTGGIAIGAP